MEPEGSSPMFKWIRHIRSDLDAYRGESGDHMVDVLLPIVILYEAYKMCPDHRKLMFEKIARYSKMLADHVFEDEEDFEQFQADFYERPKADPL